jgi:hypothetical protein
VVSEPTDMVAVRTGPAGRPGIDYDSAEIPRCSEHDGAGRRGRGPQVFKLIDALEDCDDVQNIYANFDVSDEVMAAIDAMTMDDRAGLPNAPPRSAQVWRHAASQRRQGLVRR